MDYIAAIRQQLTEINTYLKMNAKPGSDVAVAQASARERLARIENDLSGLLYSLRSWKPGPSETKED